LKTMATAIAQIAKTSRVGPAISAAAAALHMHRAGFSSSPVRVPVPKPSTQRRARQPRLLCQLLRRLRTRQLPLRRGTRPRPQHSNSLAPTTTANATLTVGYHVTIETTTTAIARIAKTSRVGTATRAAAALHPYLVGALSARPVRERMSKQNIQPVHRRLRLRGRP